MKKFICTLFLSVSLLFLCSVESIYAQDLDIYSQYAILYNTDDNIVLFEKNSDVKTSIASLTKIMTCIVAIENIDNLDEKVILTNQVFTGLVEANASVAGFRYGDEVTYRDLLMGALLPSGADATRALAINIAGSEENYVKLMNDKAVELNLVNTHFDNTTGLESATHYSTVHDIATLLQYALENDTFKEMYMTREYTASNNLKFSSTLKSISNNYTIDVSNILGSKTGYTDEAGLCMSSIANYNNVNYLLVTAGADYRGNTPRQLLDALNIYKYFSETFSYKNIINENDIISSIDVDYSKIKKYDIKASKTITKFLDNSFDTSQIKYDYVGLNSLSYKNKINDKIGVINIIYNNEIIDSLDVYLTDIIDFDLFSFLLQTNLIYIIVLCLILIILLFTTILIRKNKNS